MANYVKFKQGLKKDFNTTNQPLTNGMIYFVIDENNHGSIYYDTVVDGAKATKQGVVHRVKFSGLPIKITGSVTGTGAISADGESITINTVTNHSHGLAHMNFNVTLSDNDTDLNWTRLGNQNSEGFWLKSVRGQSKAPAWFQPDFSAGIAFGGADTKGIISLRYQNPSVRFAGGNGNAPVWYFTITGAKSATYDLSKIGGHSSDAAKLDHNITFKIDSVADATKGGNGVTTNLSGNEVKLVLPASISGFSLLQSTRFQGNADTATTAAKLGRSGNTANPMTFNWSGKDGQPTWVWGGEDGTNMYVYKPSNFKVAHATSAAGLDHDITIKINPIADATKGGNGVTTKLTEAALSLILPASLSGFNLIQSTRFQGNADTATVAAKLGNGGNTGDPMIFNWSGQGGQPTWIWGGNSKTNMYVYNPSNFKVNHAVSSTGLDHNVTFKISKVANGTTGETGVTTKLDKDESITLILPSNLSGFDNIQSTRFQGNADSATWAGYSKGLYLYPDTRQADMNFNLAGANYIKRVTYAMATSTTTKNKPPVGDANILSFGWDNSGYGSQLAIQNGGAGHLAVRGSGSSNGASSWGSWSTVLDSSNYTSYVNNYYWANVKVSTSSKTDTNPTFAMAKASNWFVSTGSTGWQNSTYGGGIYMTDTTWIRAFGGKKFYVANTGIDAIFTSGGIRGDLGYSSDAGTMRIYAEKNNEINFGGTNNSSTIYLGYRAKDSKGIPTLFMFGNSTGTATIQANAGWLGQKYLSSDNWIGWYATKGSTSSKRYGYIQTDISDNGIMRFVKEQGGYFTFNSHVMPSSNNAYDLGSSGLSWKNLHVNNISLYGQTGNRLVWTNANKGLQAGNHWAEADRVAINTTTRPGQNFYVNGSSMLTGYTYINRNYIIQNSSGGTGDIVLNVLGFKASGYPLYNDPEFANGVNSISVYNNSGNGTVTHARIDDTTCGNSSGKVLKITHTGTASPGFGGFYQNISSRANAIFIQIFRAKIPTGRNLATASNSMGDSYKDEWLTPVAGTGKWEWYARRVICGAGGTFSTGGHVYIKDGATPTSSAPLVWYLSYCNVIDVTKGNYDGLRTRYSDYVTYDAGEDGKTNKTPINDKYVAKIVTKTSNGTTFTLRGLNGAGNELTDAVLTIPNAASGKAGLITDAAQTIYGEKTLTSNLRFANVTTGVRGIVGTIADNDCWRVVGRAESTNAGYLEIATGDDTNEPIYVRQYSGTFGTVSRTFTLLDGSGRSRAPELFEAKKIHVNSGLNQSNAIADIGYQFQVTGTSNFTSTVNISGVTNHHNNIQIDANYNVARPGRSSNWYSSHNTAMIRMTTADDWSPLLAQRATNGYWILGHYNNGGAFNDQWVFGYLANSNLEGTSGASNDLSTKYRMRNVGGEKNILFSTYDTQIGSSVKPVYIKSNGEAVACSYSINSTIDSGTANRMAYYKGANEIAAAGHYVSSNQVGINATSVNSAYVFYVGGSSYFSNLITTSTGNNLGIKIGNTYVTAINGELILQNNTSIRFGGSAWDYNVWAGLKYVPTDKKIVIGLADSTNFTANSAQSGGTFLITGMTSVDFNKTASIKNLAVGGGIYWNPYVENASNASDAASITVIAGGVDGGTELRISQQNDANDVINLVVNKSIFLNSKRAFNISDSWLRINETSAFTSGIYTGSSLIRSDMALQVGASGGAFYANSAGQGFLSNCLGIAGTNTNYKLYVNGKSYFTDAIYIGSDTNGKDKNYIAFYGTYGDGEGTFNHTYIGENRFSGTSGESSELVLFKGNDQGSNDAIESAVGSGPDRIRHIAGGHLFQVYRSALSGSFSAVCASTTPSTVLEVSGSGLSIHGQKTTFTTTNSAGSYISSVGSIIRIYGNTYSNDAAYMRSKTAGVFSYGDGGPQIRFGTSYSDNQQEGALIYTDHDSAGAGVSWHFVSNQSDWNVNSKRYVARTSVTIGSLLPNTAYALYVGGGKSYFAKDINMEQNASILFSNPSQFLRWTASTTDNNGTGRNWYGIGTYKAGDNYNWLNISNYWGINITTRGNTYLQHNGQILITSGNSSGTVGSTTKPVYSDGGVLKAITSYEGNAASASKLTVNAGSSTYPIYFSGGIPVQCNGTLGNNISGNAATATTATKAGWLNKNTSLTYGTNGLQYFDNYTDTTTGSTVNANPGKDWYHIIRMNHANTGGYFVDLAVCFHSDTFSYRRIVNGIDKGWVRLIDSSNISSQSVNYAISAGKLTTNAGSATKPIYFSNGVPVQCNDTLGNNISGNAATATNANNSDTVDGYHAASFFIHDRLAATNTAGDDGLWGLTGSRSFYGVLPEGLSNIYSYGQLISFSTDNSARLQIYAAHTGSTDSTLSYRTGWGTDKRTWRTFIDSGNIGKQSVNYASSAGNADTVDGYHASDLAKKTDVSNSYVKKAGDTMTGELKNSSSDFTLSSDSSEQRFKFLNASSSKHTVYFYKGAGTSSTIVGLWDSTDGQIWTYNTSGYFNLAKRVVIGGYNNSNYSLSTSSFICNSWIRTTGSTGWYNETHGGGWYMSDNTYIRNYNSKHLYITGKLGVDCELRLWSASRQITRAGNSVSWIGGRDGALIKQDTYSGYNPILSCKTTNGSWELGPYDSNILYFAYGTDSNYKAGTNSVEHPLRLMPGRGVLLSGLNYGTSLPSSGTNGQVFFKI